MRRIVQRFLVGACLGILAGGCGTTNLPDFEPVSLESGSNTIRLELFGRFSGGFFELTSTTPQAYDPVSQRVFMVRTDVGLIDVLEQVSAQAVPAFFNVSDDANRFASTTVYRVDEVP